MLLKQLDIEEQAAAREKPAPLSPILRKTYEPLDLYARVAKFYGWSFATIDEMDYVAFFGCIEKAKQMQEEEAHAYKHAQSEQEITESELTAYLPTNREYQGPTVAVRR